MIDIAFILPNCPGPYRDANILAEHLGIGLLSAVSRENGFSSEVIDARMNNLSLDEAAKDADRFKTIGLSIISGEAVQWALQFVEKCKKINPNIHVVAGGYYSTILPERLLNQIPDIEIVVLGEGERTIIDVLSAYRDGANVEQVAGIVYKKNGNIVKGDLRNLIEDLDSNPLIYRYAHDFVDSKFEVLIEGGRGCLNNCTFCAIKPFFYNNKSIHWRARSAESLIREIKVINKIYPAAERIRFVDPDFLGDNQEGRERAIEFCDLLVSNQLSKYKFYFETRVANITEENIGLLEKLKKSGFVEIYLGLESGSDAILKTMSKKSTVQDSLNAIKILRDVGIDFVYGFMMLTPWTSMDDVNKNIAFLSKVGDVQFDRLFYRLNLIPQTPCVKIAERKNLLRGINSEGYYDYDFEYADVAALATTWDYLQKYHMDFLVEIWYTYKDIKSWGQSLPAIAKSFLEDISTISLETFHDLCTYAEHGNINLDYRNKHIGSIIKRRKQEVEFLHDKTDRNYWFPRKKTK